MRTAVAIVPAVDDHFAVLTDDGLVWEWIPALKAWRLASERNPKYPSDSIKSVDVVLRVDALDATNERAG